jgi:NADH dehydrogenase/NADH:ubiquinone oxidoreductase subunit G
LELIESRDSFYINSINEQVSVVAGPQLNLERTYMLDIYFKTLRNSLKVQQGVYPIYFNIDMPSNFRLNFTLAQRPTLEISAIFIINSNIRYEASLLNTLIRRSTKFAKLFLMYIGICVEAKYAYIHQSNNVNTLVGRYSNSNIYFKKYFCVKDIPVILTGRETRRFRYSYFLQNFISLLGKSLFVKTNKNNRLGFIHNSIGALAFAYLGITKTFNIEKTQLGNNRFLVHPSKKEFVESNNISKEILFLFDTHYTQNSKNELNAQFIYQYGLSTLYEREGHLLNIEGRLRKHQKVIDLFKNVTDLELHLTLITIFLKKYTKE